MAKDQVSKILYDGSEYTPESFGKITEDKISDIVVTQELLKTGTIYAFSDRELVDKWFQSQETPILETYKQILASIEKIDIELTPEKEQEISILQGQIVYNATARVMRELAYYKINHNEPEKIGNLKTKYDLLRGPPLQSCFIYQHSNYTGMWRYLYPGHGYPKFSWFNFNDRMTALRNFGHTVLFCKHTWWRGSRLWIWGFINIPNLSGRPWYFNDRASSAWVW